MKAKEANDIAIMECSNQIADVMSHIEQSAKKGETFITFSYSLKGGTISCLKENGFEISEIVFASTFSYVTVKWGS